jgi:hypothetical protein
MSVKCGVCWPSLWSSGQSSWLQIQKSEFSSRRYQIFWEVVGLERDPLSLVNATEELLGRKISGFGLENRDCGRRGSPRSLRDTSLSAKIGTNFADKRQALGTVHSRTKATEFVFCLFVVWCLLGSTTKVCGSLSVRAGSWVQIRLSSWISVYVLYCTGEGTSTVRRFVMWRCVIW